METTVQYLFGGSPDMYMFVRENGLMLIDLYFLHIRVIVNYIAVRETAIGD